MYWSDLFLELNLAVPVSTNNAHHLDAVILLVGIYLTDVLNLHMCTKASSDTQDSKRMKYSFIGDELNRI